MFKLNNLHISGTELQKRVISGVLGIALILSIVIFGSWPGILLLMGLLSLRMVYEFALMVYGLQDKVEKRYILLFVSWGILALGFLLPKASFEILMAVFVVLFSYYLMTASRYEDETLTLHFKELMYSIFGLIYLTFIPLYLLRIREVQYGVKWIVLFFLMIWSVDTGAYFAGKKYGHKKLYPKISPKKTVEGALGGIVTAIFVTLISKFLFFKELPLAGILIIPIFVGVVAEIGDLCESFLKRAFHQKDSGDLIPGHGGFLDRFDSVVFSLPIMYACVKLFG
jgi:phosphatidate cytidylyltransferase